MVQLFEFDAIVNEHMAELRRLNRRPATKYQRRRVIARLDRWLAGKPLLDATTEDLEAFCFRDIEPESQATELSHVRQFFAWAQRRGHIAVDPAAELRRPRIRRRIPRPIAEADLWRAIDNAPDDNRLRAPLLLAGFAGLRASEIAQLRADDLWWHTSPPIIVIADGKGGKSGTVPLHEILRDELRRCGLPSHGWLFPRRDDRPGHITGAHVSHVVNDYLHSLGLAETLHSFRHRFGTELHRASKGNARVVQEGLRHANLNTVEIYTLVTQLELAEHIANLPTRPEPDESAA